ncbi:MAG: hypothetical protein KKD94_06385 [Nanoarchaeota archaeon]|nr:hypothetical protein [Nanoarchaeota archaeon]
MKKKNAGEIYELLTSFHSLYDRLCKSYIGYACGNNNDLKTRCLEGYVSDIKKIKGFLKEELDAKDTNFLDNLIPPED